MSGEWAIDVALPLQCNPVKDYLDEKIRYWRGELEARMAHMEGGGAVLPAEKAISYIDAYQTMRYELFGEALPDE